MNHRKSILKKRPKTSLKKLDRWLAEMDEAHGPLLKMDGYNDCLAGISLRYGQEPILIYDRAKVIRRLMADGMTAEEAEEFHEFNQAGAWLGDRTPAFLVLPDL